MGEKNFKKEYYIMAEIRSCDKASWGRWVMDAWGVVEMPRDCEKGTCGEGKGFGVRNGTMANTSMGKKQDREYKELWERQGVLAWNCGGNKEL